jgi:hypothetical protein
MSEAAEAAEADSDGHAHWRAMPPDLEREKRRVLDELGTLAGIGPMP